jgi:hypothetical protein
LPIKLFELCTTFGRPLFEGIGGGQGLEGYGSDTPDSPIADVWLASTPYTTFNPLKQQGIELNV